jgi:Flp pilus assembly pilin Flp
MRRTGAQLAREDSPQELAAMWHRLRSEESGQDLVEYALLGAIVGIASIVVWQQLVTGVFNAYTASNTGVQAVSACTPDPGGGGCP